MADADFFFDPMCPWAWITSRWVTEVKSQSDVEVNWKFISLKMINSEKDYDKEFPPGYVDTHGLGLNLLRVASAVRESSGNEGVGRLYTAFGTAIHVEQRKGELTDKSNLETLLESAGLSKGFASAFDDESRDKVIADETELALTRAGKDVGTPVITFAPPDGPSFFGPVISRIPRGKEALDLWEATERIARFPGFAELKRSLREYPQFG